MINTTVDVRTRPPNRWLGVRRALFRSRLPSTLGQKFITTAPHP
ncbi:hypothetical protein LAUMK4_01272 [Mycobacterium persicum]|uniref:Uncharacterized protein n=1 Tax=Mycobacterium persicum TaxID=1487726 RepID=A0AB38UQ75_9MYCO|nr:hypothetical protein LAUMK15_01634 [Mycobacterium persicum]VAZ82682.1 hypothetical protein LAUMK42_01490 [Mycobacterium persicum]VAZ90010.1 hypothetical protein LAUMK4_01272 [Mycobacterium persicum]